MKRAILDFMLVLLEVAGVLALAWLYWCLI
jgi:hypothetical protein